MENRGWDTPVRWRRASMTGSGHSGQPPAAYGPTAKVSQLRKLDGVINQRRR